MVNHEDDIDLGGYLRNADDVAGWVRKAAKAAGRPTVEMAVGLVHEQCKPWLAHLGRVESWLPVEEYVLTPVYRRNDLALVHPQAKALLDQAHREAMRGKAFDACLALVVGPKGELSALHFQLAAGDRVARAVETLADNHVGFED